MKEDRELAVFRDLMLPPSKWDEGYNLKSVIGAVFVGLVMMPGSMYMSLVAGGDLGPAARWVTVILFIEVARRAFTTMKRPEIFVLYYMAGAAIGSPFFGLLWNQYYVQSEAARDFGFLGQFPEWYAPPQDVLNLRTFFHAGWVPAITVIILAQVISRIDYFGLGYALYRITSDVERLPFPMAPVGAMGVTALAESSEGKETWRWRVFSIGSVLGLAFGLIYMGVPTVTGVFLHEPIKPIPIPFIDFTTDTERILPAVPMALSLDATHFLVGMVLPFSAMLGELVGFGITVALNPFLQRIGQLRSWSPGDDVIRTSFLNTVDFYYSFGIGIAFAIAVIGFYHVWSSLRRASAERGAGPKADWSRLFKPPAGRGDINFFLSIGLYLASTTAYICLCKFWLVPNFKTIWLIGYGFIYTPIISYVSARMEGIVGQHVDIPLVREGVFILSGYQGIDIWFAPIPLHNYSAQVVHFRQVELTGTKFTSLIKAELTILPIVIVTSILFSQFIWRLAPVPSNVYPFAEKMWHLQALNMSITYSATQEGGGIFAYAFRPPVIGIGLGASLMTYAILSKLGLPIMLVYGAVRGIGQTWPHIVIPHFIGALVGRYVFLKRYGATWRQYAPVLLAGFSCGMGLISMLALGFVLISKAIFQMPY